ncbi:AMP-binding protein [Solihabitans fulvus]|uniref:AMP-binding protein n=1 Tax=Solihabitans fulvus TaxID=1892852 RepID=A0A5B2XSH9_9PSEU|nr:AMP-binding protein [Solihabitans fulvus]KAA2265809.1 AMP-binding protein [Solihabitans fulvus]
MALLLAEAARSRGGEAAIRDERRTLDWSGLNRAVNRWVALLRAIGLSTGDTVAVVSGNRVEVFELLLGCLHAGLTVVPVNWQLTAEEIAHLLADCGSRAVVVDEDRADVVAAAIDLSGVDGVSRLVTGRANVSGFRAVEPLVAEADDAEPPEQRCGSILLYTSGSTGTPKGVVNGAFRVAAPLTEVSRLLTYAAKVLGVPSDSRALLVGPWYHSAQLYFALLPLLRGCELLIRRRFEAEETLRLIDAERIGVCHLVPTQFVRLLRLPDEVRRRFGGGSLRRVWHGGGPCAPEVKRRMIDWWGPVVVEYYAATEGGVVTLIEAAEWLSKPGSVGRAVPPTRIHIAAPDGTELPVGAVGRVFFRRGRAQDFHYRRDPEQTSAAHLAPGVYTYGELGYVDEDGYLFLTGRAKQLIVSGGVNIHPMEVEAALLAHPAVRDVAVIGIPDEEFGERVLAVVQLCGGLIGDTEAAEVLARHCRERLAGFKVPRAWRVVERLPRDDAGKLRHNDVRRALGPR